MEESCIRTEDLRRRFVAGGQEIWAVNGITLEIPKRQLTVIRGRSGGGKTTLMNLLGGLDVPTSGKVFVGDTEISALGDRERDAFRRKNVGFVFQSVALITMMSALENVEFTLRMAGVPSAEREKRSREALRMVGLEARAGHMASELSGGEQQRVAVARAIAPRPPILFADEPTAELDSGTGRSVMKLLKDLTEEITVIMTTHDEALAAMADREFMLEDGVLL